ncbi:MAG: hypothetical protein NTZ09_01905 [Candidatus Hydrogenedentes bacterium]|nr:hypothetical protein [Candidatus Hydrogenedentota bacterium]
MNDQIRSLVMQRAPGSAIKQAAIHSGMLTLRKTGALKAAQGITTVDEILRVTQVDQDF